MSLNKDQRNALIDAVNQSALEPDQKSSLMGLLNEKKRYGLVWEDKPEYAKERMKNELPVLVDVPERYVEGASPDSPHHVLIEGDNYNALTALQYTHAGKVDVIYIDPPYNTGNKDFSYQDTFKDEPEFIDREHRFRHSTWLSFMEKRLKLAKALLKETGVIFISIDDNEQAQLKLLCDEIFGEGNFLNNIIWQKKFSPQNDAKYFSDNHDFIVVYKKSDFTIQLLQRTSDQDARYKNPDNDPRGPWTSGDCSVKTYNANTDYPITTPSGRIVKPPLGYCWRFNKEKFSEMVAENRVWFGEDGNNVPRVKRFLTDVKAGVTPLTIWLHEDVNHNQGAKQEMNSILADSNTDDVFSTPKPVKLIDRILRLSLDPVKPTLILDFFAGSGTTLHATMALNAEDGGKRQCILVTNNENDICEQVTYERNKRVIQGYTNSKGQAVEGLKDNHLHYFKVDFTPSEKTISNQRTLTSKLAGILRLKENAFTSVHSDMDKVRIWKGTEKNILLVQDVTGISDAVQWIAQQEMPCKVYVFAPGAYPFVDDFAEVENKVELIAMPEAYRDAIEIALPTESLLSQGGAE